MANKKRKTRKQKKLAELRHNFTHSLLENTNFETKIRLETSENPKISSKNSTVASLNEYPFLLQDLSKTGILTALILGFQIALFFLLKNNILKIPGLIY